MSVIPSDDQKIEVTGSSVDFFKLEKDGQSTYYFDTSKCGPPEPMVNAMCGLKLISGTDAKLVMINHKTPGGLFAKLKDDVSHEIVNLDNGLVQVVFSSNLNASSNSDFDQDCAH